MNGIHFTLTDNRLAAIFGAAEAAGEKLVETTANNIVARMKNSIQHGAKTGRTYGRGASKYRKIGGVKTAVAYRFHRASAPGEAPASDTGYLAHSLQVRRTGRLQRLIYVGAEYSYSLEFGASRIKPRPFMRPAFEVEAPAFKAAVGKLVKST